MLVRSKTHPIVKTSPNINESVLSKMIHKLKKEHQEIKTCFVDFDVYFSLKILNFEGVEVKPGSGIRSDQVEFI